MSQTIIGFSTPNYFNPISALIRWITKSKVSHAWFMYHDTDFDLDMVMEAHELGFRLIPFEKFKLHNKVVDTVTPDVNLDPGLKLLAHSLGDIYDYWGLLGMGVVLLGHWFKRKWKNPLQSPKHMFCSEAVVTALQACGSKKAESLTPGSTSPQMLRDTLCG